MIHEHYIAGMNITGKEAPPGTTNTPTLDTLIHIARTDIDEHSHSPVKYGGANMFSILFFYSLISFVKSVIFVLRSGPALANATH